jgi:hypothetical protein
VDSLVNFLGDGQWSGLGSLVYGRSCGPRGLKSHLTSHSSMFTLMRFWQAKHTGAILSISLFTGSSWSLYSRFLTISTFRFSSHCITATRLLITLVLPSIRPKATHLVTSTSPSLSEAGESQQHAISQMVTHPPRYQPCTTLLNFSDPMGMYLMCYRRAPSG